MLVAPCCHETGPNSCEEGTAGTTSNPWWHTVALCQPNSVAVVVERFQGHVDEQTMQRSITPVARLRTLQVATGSICLDMH
jgi:hypothetical protein